MTSLKICMVVFFSANYKENPYDNPYLYCWLISAVISSIYGYAWDIKMDWGLFDKSAGENKFLREEIVYSSTVRKTIKYLYQIRT